jgi:CRISPR/Cas system-associated endoribonuclease Cas2
MMMRWAQFSLMMQKLKKSKFKAIARQIARIAQADKADN